jgi:hypothetical protein
MIVIVLLVVALCLSFVPAVIFGLRRRRRPAELRGDWWPLFEAEFRAYAARVAQASERGQLRRDARRPPPSLQ